MSLDLQGVGVRLSGRTILKDLDVQFQPGQVTALVGPNGAGKSTLLKAIAGLVPLHAGRIRLDEADIVGMSTRQRARRIALVPQEPNFDYAFPVGEVVGMGRYAHIPPMKAATEADEEAVADAIEDLRLGAHVHRAVNRLSRGEQQRVLVARALAQAPRAFLFDEPTASLDLGVAHRVERIMGRLAADGHIVIVAIHDLEAASHLADRFVVLERGQIAATGTPRETITDETLRRVFGVEAHITWEAGLGARIFVNDVPDERF
jgi:iron complex transport system ATP-binding protein